MADTQVDFLRELSHQVRNICVNYSIASMSKSLSAEHILTKTGKNAERDRDGKCQMQRGKSGETMSNVNTVDWGYFTQKSQIFGGFFTISLVILEWKKPK